MDSTVNEHTKVQHIDNHLWNTHNISHIENFKKHTSSILVL
jgi:hypothetical protein